MKTKLKDTAGKLIGSAKTFLDTFKEPFIFVLIICFTCEIFIFNARYFLNYLGYEAIDMRSAEVNITDMEYNSESGLFIPTGNSAIEITNIGQPVTTMYIDAFLTANTQEFQIFYADEDHSARVTVPFTIINGVEESKYLSLHLAGNVDTIQLIYSGRRNSAHIKNITLNKPIPLKIYWPRFILFSLSAMIAVIIKQKKLFFAPLNPKSKCQTVLFAGVAILFAVFLFFLMLFSAPFASQIPLRDNFANNGTDQYNTEMVDALLAGQVHLNIEPPAELLELEEPYDRAARQAVGADRPWDHVLYNGKLYSYFGIVQVLTLSLPYRIITGSYIPTRVAVFIFAALASIFLMLVWRQLAYTHMKNMPLGVFTLGQVAVVACSMITFLVNNPSFYAVAGASGLFFTSMGLWYILRSAEAEKINREFLFPGCLFMALAVGCRPNHAFFLFLIPVILYEHIKSAWHDKKNFFITFIIAAAPVAVVAGGLMWYNYIRFDSVLEFGASYQLTLLNNDKIGLVSLPGKITKAVVCTFCYLVPSFDIRVTFPFVYIKRTEIGSAFLGYIYNYCALGLLSLPIMWPLAVIRRLGKTAHKRNRLIFYIAYTMILIGILQIVTVSTTAGGIHTRYEADFFWLFAFAAMICLHFIYDRIEAFQQNYNGGEQILLKTNIKNTSVKIISAAVIISILLMFLVSLSSSEGNTLWNNNPNVLYYIQRLLGFDTW